MSQRAEQALAEIVAILDQEVDADLDIYEHQAQRIYTIARAALSPTHIDPAVVAGGRETDS